MGQTLAGSNLFLCTTCGTQLGALTEGPPALCAICQDSRQFVGWNGQEWTTLAQMQGNFHNVVKEEELGLHSIHTQPKIGIGQRALVVQTTKGNFLWDCVPLLDGPTIETIRNLGGLIGIAISHPHYYTTMVEWSHAFGKVPIFLHRADQLWVQRMDPVLQLWDGASITPAPGLTLINTGGHFDGFQVLHWCEGANGKGVLMSGDQPQVCQDRRWVSFMYSYPNLIPLPAAVVSRIRNTLRPLVFDRLYGAFPGLTIPSDAHEAVERSADRYIQALGG